MSHRIEVGVVEAYHDDAAQATVRVSVDVHEGDYLVVVHEGREIDLEETHIEGSDEIKEGKLMAVDIPEPVAVGDKVYRIVED